MKYTAEDIKCAKQLKSLGYDYIARDEKDNKLYAFSTKPRKHIKLGIWTLSYRPIRKTGFKAIAWTDAEPTAIDDILSQ